ncbi:MAG TPA: carboxypeptidase-like regulatory domain-containing protein [Bryobacteraceae bacterium]
MWKLVLGAILVVVCIQGQTFQDLLLPQARHITGVVIDAEGQPVVDAHIDHTDDRRQAHQTDSEGRFEVDTRAPILVIRKVGFRSELVRTQGVTEPRITLQKLTENRVFPTCSNTGQYDGIDGWGASFQFPRTPVVKASRQSRDIDYGARSYYTETKQGPKGITQGSGPLWSFGTPLDEYVWRSVKYEELTYDAGGPMIIDARGQFPNGNRWRDLGKFGESASYSDIDEATAKILDQFLDGACLKPTPRR